MSRPRAPQVLPAYLLDRRLLRAWEQAGAGYLHPACIEVLKRKSLSTVYRLIDAEDGRPALIAKRCRTATGRLESLIYDRILAGLPLPSLRCHGLAPEPDTEFGWLFLEDAGRTEYSPASRRHRVLAGRWLGMLHAFPPDAGLRALLPDRGPCYYHHLLRVSRAALQVRVHHPALSPGEAHLLRTLVAHLEAAEAHWPRLEAFLDDQPRSLVHGDFVIKNLRMREGGAGPALMVMDWEMAGWGVPAADLAQFVGKCASPDLRAYRSVLAGEFGGLTLRDLRRQADCGSLLRILHKIYWEVQSMEGDSYAVMARSLASFSGYEPQFATALRALHREVA
jgi:hypothetical protein